MSFNYSNDPDMYIAVGGKVFLSESQVSGVV